MGLGALYVCISRKQVNQSSPRTRLWSGSNVGYRQLTCQCTVFPKKQHCGRGILATPIIAGEARNLAEWNRRLPIDVHCEWCSCTIFATILRG
jgi:hypothetical protein